MISMTWPQSLRREATICGRVIRMTPHEFSIVERLLLTSPDRFVEIEDMIAAIWPDPDLEPETSDKALQHHIYDLRRLGVVIESRRDCGRGHHGAWRIPDGARGRECQRAAA